MKDEFNENIPSLSSSSYNPIDNSIYHETKDLIAHMTWHGAPVITVGASNEPIKITNNYPKQNLFFMPSGTYLLVRMIYHIPFKLTEISMMWRSSDN